MSVADVRIDQEINLRGEVCPYTFVKSKLALEQMQSGQVLKVIIDHEPAVKNVPQSMKNEGNEVLGVDSLAENEWAIIVRKA